MRRRPTLRALLLAALPLLAAFGVVSGTCVSLCASGGNVMPCCQPPERSEAGGPALIGGSCCPDELAAADVQVPAAPPRAEPTRPIDPPLVLEAVVPSSAPLAEEAGLVRFQPTGPPPPAIPLLLRKQSFLI